MDFFGVFYGVRGEQERGSRRTEEAKAGGVRNGDCSVGRAEGVGGELRARRKRDSKKVMVSLETLKRTSGHHLGTFGNPAAEGLWSWTTRSWTAKSSKLKDECPHPCKTWRVSRKGRSLVLPLVHVSMRVKTLQLYPPL